MAHSVLYSLPEQMAELNENAVIITVNKAWKKFQSSNKDAALDRVSVGENYLRALRKGYGTDKKFTCASRAISSVLMGDREKFSIEYQCRAGGQKMLFRLSVTPLKTVGALKEAGVTHTDVTKRKAAELETRMFPATDPMIGILNRKAGLESVYKQMKYCERLGCCFMFCYIDLDNLKRVNNSFGHKEGDRIIILLVNILRRALRESDDMCRLGGGEILLIFQETGLEAANAVLKRIQISVDAGNSRSTKPYRIEFSY
jgi:diguanylate cyclase (GGDEF)-like protein